MFATPHSGTPSARKARWKVSRRQLALRKVEGIEPRRVDAGTLVFLWKLFDWRDALISQATRVEVCLYVVEDQRKAARNGFAFLMLSAGTRGLFSNFF
jgi:hypothetical protein